MTKKFGDRSVWLDRGSSCSGSECWAGCSIDDSSVSGMDRGPGWRMAIHSVEIPSLKIRRGSTEAQQSTEFGL